MVLAKAADAVMRRLIPQVEASAACAVGCQVRNEYCKNQRVYFRYYYRNSNCTWGAYCYERRTGHPCA